MIGMAGADGRRWSRVDSEEVTVTETETAQTRGVFWFI